MGMGMGMGLGDGVTGIPFRLLVGQVREGMLLALEHATPGLNALAEDVEAPLMGPLPAFFSYAVVGTVDLGEGLTVEVDSELSTLHHVCGERSPLALLLRATKDGKVLGSFEYEVSPFITNRWYKWWLATVTILIRACMRGTCCEFVLDYFDILAFACENMSCGHEKSLC